MRGCDCIFCMEDNEPLVSANVRDVLHLRPTRKPRVSGMTNPTRTFRWFLLIIVIEVLLLTAVGLAISHKSEAAAPPSPQSTPADCQRLWEDARPGERWPIKQACLRRIELRKCRTLPRVTPRAVTVKGVRVDSGQRHVISWIVSEGLRRRLTNRTIITAALMATTQESSARELHHGEGSSLGPFQLISSHGTPEQRISVEFSGKWFYDRAVRMYYRGEDPAHLAQQVEASAYPGAYAQWLTEARQTLKLTAGRCPIRP